MNANKSIVFFSLETSQILTDYQCIANSKDSL